MAQFYAEIQGNTREVFIWLLSRLNPQYETQFILCI